jgi:hypothetical protein
VTPLRWVRIREGENAELWKLDKPDPNGRSVTTFYRGRLFEVNAGERSKTEKEAKFTDFSEALAWFEQCKGG